MPAKRRKGQRKDGMFQSTVSMGLDADGKRLRRVFYGSTQSIAKAKADVFREQIGQGYDPDAGKMSVQAWAHKWLQTYKVNVAPKTLQYYMSTINQINSRIGHMALKDVRPIDVQSIFNSLAGMSNSSIRKMLVCIRQLFKTAYHNNIIMKDPTTFLTIPRGTTKGHRALSAYEIELLCAHWTAHRTGLWAMLMLFTGMRRGEACALKWDDIDMAAKEIHVSASVSWLSNQPILKTTKTAAGVRTIPLLEPLETALDKYQRMGDFVCTTNSGVLLSGVSFFRGWQSLMSLLTMAANGEPVRLNPGRRTDKTKQPS